MSRPPTFAPPPRARVYRLETARGGFAVVDAPAATERVRGTALLLPGYTGSKEDFGPLHEILNAAGYRTVAVDGRGQHESAGPKDDQSAYAQAELAADVHAQAAALGTPLHLLGHSLGGQIARAAVLDDHTPFRSLTLMSSGPAEISAAQQERVRLLGSVLGEIDMAEVWEAVQAFEAQEEGEPGVDEGVLDPGPGRQQPEAADPDRFRRRWLLTSPAQLLATGQQLCTEPDRVGELARVPLPLHVISGATDGIWPVPLLDEMALRLGARRTIVPGADHSPNTDRPKPTATALAAFWDEVDPYEGDEAHSYEEKG
ncbi:alpha/beta fold hydrolase [Streptomyces physcomitrii]|uniref:Alpha/beta hydrolase n=1 Tax=Streptomyces physcomitrii TaxID=2724184 RepID=A0ABX1GVC1_9ACTN|nr:alpha/beta hydrolase [Streptomyces physcomitrii]NKI40025.1 alpha/beta hydrolase [Streptomyces physcomitrii]